MPCTGIASFYVVYRGQGADLHKPFLSPVQAPLQGLSRGKARCPRPLKVEPAEVARDVHHLADEE